MSNAYIKITGKKGHPTWISNRKLIYSQYDPYKEAVQYLSTMDLTLRYIITCCGADFINQTLTTMHPDKIILSFEPVEFEPIFTHPNLKRFKNLNELENYIIQNRINAVHFIIWDPLIESNPEIFLKLLTSLKDFIVKHALSIHTEEKISHLEIRNLTINLFKAKGSFLENTPENIHFPVLIAASGNSLSDSLQFIKKVRDYVYLIALPSSLPILQANEIHPDFVIAVDPGYGTFYHLSKYKKQVKLLCPLSIHPSIFNLANYEFIFFNYNSEIENILFKNMNAVTSISEGSVIFNLLHILNNSGVYKVILAGQDFGYYNHKLHCSGGSFETEFFYKADYFESFFKDLSIIQLRKDKLFISAGDKTYPTDFALKVYYQHFLIQNYPFRIFLIDGLDTLLHQKLPSLSVEDIINHHSQVNCELFNIRPFNLDWKTTLPQVYETVNQLKSELNEIQSYALKQYQKRLLHLEKTNDY